MIRIPQTELVPVEVRYALLRRYEQLLLTHKEYVCELIALLRNRAEYPDLVSDEDLQARASFTGGELEACPEANDCLLLDYFVFLVNIQTPDEDVPFLLPDGKQRKAFDFFRRAYSFCSRWKLPAELWQSVFYEVVLFPAGGALALADALEKELLQAEPTPIECIRACYTQEKLEALARFYAIPLDAPNFDVMIGEVLNLPKPVFSSCKSWIDVNPAPPPTLPEYNPLTDTRKSYLARVQQIVDAYCEQVGANWRTAGWRGEQAFSHYRNPEYLQRIAKQAFMRVVLRKGWGAIRNAVQPNQQLSQESRSMIKRSTERAIELLQITERYESVFLPIHQLIQQAARGTEQLGSAADS